MNGKERREVFLRFVCAGLGSVQFSIGDPKRATDLVFKLALTALERFDEVDAKLGDKP